MTRAELIQRQIQLVAAAHRVLKETPLRHERERVYQTLGYAFDHLKADASAALAALRKRFKDEATHGVVTCACGQKNRIDLRWTHDNDVGPRCGRCGVKLSEENR